MRRRVDAALRFWLDRHRSPAEAPQPRRPAEGWPRFGRIASESRPTPPRPRGPAGPARQPPANRRGAARGRARSAPSRARFAVDRRAGDVRREWAHSAARMRETIERLRPILSGAPSTCDGRYVRSHGFRLRRPMAPVEDRRRGRPWRDEPKRGGGRPPRFEVTRQRSRRPARVGIAGCKPRPDALAPPAEHRGAATRREPHPPADPSPPLGPNAATYPHRAGDGRDLNEGRMARPGGPGWALRRRKRRQTGECEHGERDWNQAHAVNKGHDLSFSPVR